MTEQTARRAKVFAVLSWLALFFAPALALAETSASTASGIPSGEVMTFWVFGTLTLVSALLMLTRKNPVSAALCLVLCLGCTAGIYLALHATFLAVMQVLVYAGAIMVLFMFVVMAVAQYDDEEIGLARGWHSKLVGVVATLFMAYMVINVIAHVAGEQTVRMTTRKLGDVREIGRLFFTDYMFPFEAVSLLLLVAIVGAVMITRKPRPLAGTASQTGVSRAAGGDA